MTSDVAPLFVHDVTHRVDMRRQTYCGPAAISALTGRTAECAAAWINTRRQHDVDRLVKGTFLLETLWTMHALGYGASLEKGWDPRSPDRPTLLRWMREHRQTESGLYLLSTTDHWMVVQSDTVLCSNQPVRRHISEAKFKRKRVWGAFRIELTNFEKAIQLDEPMPGPRPVVKLTEKPVIAEKPKFSITIKPR